MRKEKGTVIKAYKNIALVRTTKTNACESCSSKKSCHTVGGGNDMEVEVLNPVYAKEGDDVEIGFKSSSLMKLTFFVYLFPIVSLLFGAIIGDYIAVHMKYDQSILAAIFSFLLFFLSFVFVRYKSKKMAENSEYIPKIIKIIYADYKSSQK